MAFLEKYFIIALYDVFSERNYGMTFSVQRAGLWKRISAFLFDAILLGIAAVLLALCLSAALGYDGYLGTLNAAYEKYGAEYGVDFSLSLSEYDALTGDENERLREAYAALGADEAAVRAYNMMIRLTAAITAMSLLLAFAILEYAVPLLMKNGQTLGKKIFSLGLMRADGVRVSATALFIRTFLGKYAIGTMVPVFILLMLYFGSIGLAGTIVLLGLAVLQLTLLLATYYHTPVHDLLAGTVEIDLPSQMIFESREALIAYKEKVHAEKAAAQPY